MRKYYKYEDWTQPILTDEVTHTALGDIIVQATSNYGGNCQPYKIMIGKVSTTVDVDYWQLNNTAAYQFLKLSFPYTLRITGLKVTSRPRDNYTRSVEAYTDKRQKIGNTVNCTAAVTEYTFLDSSAQQSYITNSLNIEVLAGNNNNYFGLQNLKITAQRLAESTSQDYDFYIDVPLAPTAAFKDENIYSVVNTPVRKYYKYGITPNANVVGTPTCYNGVISGFSTSSYITYNGIIPTITSFEQVMLVQTPRVNATQTISAGNPFKGLGSIKFTNQGKIILYASSNGTSNDITGSGGTISSLSVLANTNYWIKYHWDGSTYKIDVSTDGETYTNYISISNSNAPAFNGYIGIGTDTGDSNNNPWLGSIDLNKSYIKINGEYWWHGTKAETDYYYKNITVNGSLYEHDGLVSGFSSSDYMTIPVELASTNNAEYVFCIVTGNDVTGNQPFAQATRMVDMSIYEGDLSFYTWDGTHHVIGAASPNTKYWIKEIVNNKTKTYSYSTDGINFSTPVSGTESDMSTPTSFTLGVTNNLNLVFLGSIVLDECYININNQRVWQPEKIIIDENNYDFYKDINTYFAMRTY